MLKFHGKSELAVSDTNQLDKKFISTVIDKVKYYLIKSFCCNQDGSIIDDTNEIKTMDSLKERHKTYDEFKLNTILLS